jgi:hypothetical protein
MSLFMGLFLRETTLMQKFKCACSAGWHSEFTFCTCLLVDHDTPTRIGSTLERKALVQPVPNKDDHPQAARRCAPHNQRMQQPIPWASRLASGLAADPQRYTTRYYE